MAEALETFYPLREKVGRRARPGYIVNGRAVELSSVPFLQAQKRFSDAELAAEYWAPAFIHFPDPEFFERDFDEVEEIVRERAETVRRFAVHPHEFAVARPTRTPEGCGSLSLR